MPKVALLVETHAGYARGILRGIARYVHLHGPWLIYVPAEELPPVDLALPSVVPWDGNGIIGRILTRRIADQVLSAGVPVIGMDLSEDQLAPGNPLSQISELRPDSQAAGRMAAEHFLERGFSQFAFCGYAGQIWSRHREDGYRARLAEAGFPCSVYNWSQRRQASVWERQRSHMIQWIRSLVQPVGLMACNDHCGRQVLEACMVAGLHVPEDVAVVGADDDQLLCDLANPPLSSIKFNAEKAGFRAAELLAGLMSGSTADAQQVLAEPLGVTARRSSDVVAVEDRHVARAVRFIRDNARRSIQVSDVVSESGIGRRALEIRFRKTFKQSIRSRIQREHLAWAKRLLAETELPMVKIAELSGFNSLSYLSNVFRQRTGMTLAQYRRDTRPG